MLPDYLDKRIKIALTKIGINSLTEIQELVIPEILKEEDILFSAPTGYGKTLAAFIPCLQRMNEDAGLQLLYITPLRSLNRQIFASIIQLASYLDLEVDIRHGDTSSYERKMQSYMPPNALIITPEALQSIFLSKRMLEHIKSVKYVIVDEVQSYLESKRGTQLNFGLTRLRRFATFQSIGISATLPDPQEGMQLIGAKKFIDLNKTRQYDIEVIYPEIKEESEEKNYFEQVVDEGMKFIANKIEESKSTIVFCNTRETAEMVGSRLRKLLQNKVEVHHSSISREEREKIEREFREGEIKALVATSSMELGIDVGNVDLVIQYMSPRQVIKLMQRVGRSNHNFTGIAKGIVFTTNIDDYAEALAIKEFVNKRLEKLTLPKKSLDILAHQIIGLNIDGINSIKQMYEITKNTYCYKDLTEKEFLEVISFLEREGMIKTKGDTIERTPRGQMYYINAISTIPSYKALTVIDSETNTKIGTLDREFLDEVEEDSTFIMKGEAWKLSKIDYENEKVYVYRAKSIEGALPSWNGEMIAVDSFVSLRATEIKNEIKDRFGLLQEQATIGFPNKDLILIDKINNYLVIHSPFGSKINEAMAKALTTRIARETGEKAISNISPYRIIIKTTLTPEIIKEWLNTELLNYVSMRIEDTLLFEHRFINVLSRFGLIRKNADINKSLLRALISKYRNDLPFIETVNEILRDKFDIDGLDNLLQGIEKGEIKVEVKYQQPITYLAFENLFGNLILKPEEARKNIIEITKYRLLESKLYFRCMRCGYKIGELKVKDSEGLKCPNCGARYIACIKPKIAGEIDQLLDRYFEKKKLSEEDIKTLNRIKAIAELFLGYGVKASMVIAAYGIGPNTAKRILSKYYSSEEKLIDAILESERAFVENKDIWRE
jgi:ATP-dependent Lhr-like helicase